MLSIVSGVVQGVLGAGLVAGCGMAMKRAKLVDESGISSLSKMIYHLFNPAFAFHSIASVPRVLLIRGLWIVLGAAVSLLISSLLGLVVVSLWPASAAPSTKVGSLTKPVAVLSIF